MATSTFSAPSAPGGPFPPPPPAGATQSFLPPSPERDMEGAGAGGTGTGGIAAPGGGTGTATGTGSGPSVHPASLLPRLRSAAAYGAFRPCALACRTAGPAVPPRAEGSEGGGEDGEHEGRGLRDASRIGRKGGSGSGATGEFVGGLKRPRPSSGSGGTTGGWGSSVCAVAGPLGVAVFSSRAPHRPSVVLHHSSPEGSPVSALEFQPLGGCADASDSRGDGSGGGGNEGASVLLAAARGGAVLVWDASGRSLSPLLGRLSCDARPERGGSPSSRQSNPSPKAAFDGAKRGSSPSSQGGTDGGGGGAGGSPEAAGSSSPTRRLRGPIPSSSASTAPASPPHRRQSVDQAKAAAHTGLGLYSGDVTSVSWRGPSLPLLAASAERTVCLWDLRGWTSRSRPSARFDADLGGAWGGDSSPFVHVCCDGSSHRIAVLDASGIVRVYDDRVAGSIRSPRSRSRGGGGGGGAPLATFRAHDRAGVGIACLGASSSGPSSWLTWGVDDAAVPPDGEAGGSGGIGIGGAACVKVWEDVASSPSSRGSPADSESYWFMDNDDDNGGGDGNGSAGATRGEMSPFSLRAKFGSPDLSCARVCPQPFAAGIVTVGPATAAGPGDPLGLPSSGAGAGGWRADLWVLDGDGDVADTRAPTEAGGHFGARRAAAFRFGGRDDSDLSSMMGGRGRYDPGRLIGAELAVGSSMTYPLARARDDNVPGGGRGDDAAVARGDDAGGDGVGGGRGELVVCCLSSTGVLTTHAIPEASPPPPALSPTSLGGWRRGALDDIVIPAMGGGSAASSAAVTFGGEAGGGKSPLSPALSKRLHPNFRTFPTGGSAEGRVGLARGVGETKIYRSSSDKSLRDFLAAANLEGGGEMGRFQVGAAEGHGAGVGGDIAMLRADTLGRLGPGGQEVSPGPGAVTRGAAGLLIDGMPAPPLFQAGGRGDSDGAGPPGPFDDDDPVVSLVSRGVEGGTMQFDMDVPVSPVDGGAPAAAATAVAGAVTVVTGAEPGAVTGGAVVEGKDMDMGGSEEPGAEGDGTSAAARKRVATIDPFRAMNVPCPRLCGASFGFGCGGLISFQNGEVRRLWSWFRSTGRGNGPAWQPMEGDGEGRGGQSSSSGGPDSSRRRGCPRTMLDLMRMNAAAKIAQWGDDNADTDEEEGGSDRGDDDDLLSEEDSDSDSGSSTSGNQSDSEEDLNFIHNQGMERVPSRDSLSLYDRYFGDSSHRKIGRSGDGISDITSRRRRLAGESKADPSSVGASPFAAVGPDHLAPVVSFTRAHDPLVWNGQCPELVDGLRLGPWWLTSEGNVSKVGGFGSLGNSRASATASQAKESRAKIVRGARGKTSDNLSEEGWGWVDESGNEVSGDESYRQIFPPLARRRSDSDEKAESSSPPISPNKSFPSMNYIMNMPPPPLLETKKNSQSQAGRQGALTGFKKLFSYPQQGRVVPARPISREKITTTQNPKNDAGTTQQDALGVYSLSPPPHVGLTDLALGQLLRTKELCENNARFCASLGQMDKARVWDLLAQIVDNLPRTLDDPFDGWGGPGGGALGKEIVENILQYYESQGDVQMLSTIVCVLKGGRDRRMIKRMTTQEGRAARSALHSLLPDYDRRFDAYMLRYSVLLYFWGKLTARTELRKHMAVSLPGAGAEQLFPLETASSRSSRRDFPNEDIAPGISVAPICPRCLMPAKPGTNVCASCKDFAFRCSICANPVKGQFTACLTCGHGGHVDHIIPWFQKFTVCPTGCGCNCVLSTYGSSRDGKKLPYRANQASAQVRRNDVGGLIRTSANDEVKENILSNDMPGIGLGAVPFGAYVGQLQTDFPSDFSSKVASRSEQGRGTGVTSAVYRRSSLDF